MIYKCKICGGTLELDQQNGIGICEYCGTRQALPLFSDESAKLLYERGNSYLSQSEYDKAESVFNQLLSINPNAAELYWDLVLCKYGVTYVKDPKTGKYIPTCNRTHYTPIFTDKNYLKAIELSSGKKQTLFKADAKTIDNIQKGIIAVSKKEKPFDIFISYKETDANGNRTKDSLVAQSLYEKLTEAGYKVFFSRITLEDKVGTEYEPYIYSALYSSKVMLAIGSCKENFEAVWVKNEWSRFLNLRQSDASKTLIPLYFYMSQYELPQEFAVLQAQDMNTEQFDKELLRGIKKLIPLPVMLAAKRKKVKKAIIAVVATLCVVAVATVAMLTPKFIQHQKYGAQYKAAEQLYYDGNYPEATWAFAEISDYKDAAEMKDKAELSWRKSLATVVDTDWNGGYGESYQDKNGVYYINQNGSVDTIENLVGEAHKNIDISKHGNVISIAAGTDNNGNEMLYALHANGYVSNAKENNNLEDDSEWHNIVKMTPKFGNTNFALRSDGTMLFGKYYESEHLNLQWTKDLPQWESVVDFTYAYSTVDFILIGITEEGELCGAYQLYKPLGYDSTHDYSTISFEKNFKNILTLFDNVKSVKVGFEYTEDLSVTIFALTNDNQIQKYQNGEFTEESASGICNIISTKYALESSGDLIDLETGDTILRDIVTVADNNRLFPISKTGTIYGKRVDFVDDIVSKNDSKTIVYDEWLERLD